MAVKSVKVWQRNGDKRVYVKNEMGFESCYFVTGNNWDKAGTWRKQGKFGIKKDEMAEARELAFVDGKWTNYPAPQEQPHTHRHAAPCPDCGGWDCNSNCVSNLSIGAY